MKKSYALVVVMLMWAGAFAQSTYSRVYTILQSNCAATCHSSANHAGNLDLSGSAAAVRTALVNVTPSNSASAALGNKLIDPGNPKNSFLFKKIHMGIEANLSLTAGENAATHDSLTALTVVEREMIRQWILFGAKDTGTWADEATITTYYVDQGGFPKVQAIAPPAPNEGVQIHWGPLFMQPGTEFEYYNKFPIGNTQKIDVTRMNVVENDESHHYALYKFHPGGIDSIAKPGMQKVVAISSEALLFYSCDVIAQWPNNIDLHYPQGTAYVWDSASKVAISYHLINYNDSIIAAEAYMNVYFGPHQTNTIPILTDQIRYGGDNVGDLVIFAGTGDGTFTIDQHDPDSAFLWNIISLQAHTHKKGKAYNVMLRNNDGTPGDTIYKGSYSADYSHDQFAYLWDNPPYEQFDPPYQVDMRKGMIHKATFKRDTITVGFGLKTTDEMFVTFVVFYKSQYTGIRDDIYTDSNLKLYPNPVSNTAFIELKNDQDLENAEVKIYDLMGKEMADVKGISDKSFMIDMSQFPNGYYMYQLRNNGVLSGTGKVVVRR